MKSAARRGSLLLLTLALFGCGPQRSAPASSPPASHAAVADSSAPTPVSDGRSPAAAADLVRRYYAAIDARDYHTAYTLWGPGGGASGKTYEQFAAGFAQTAHSGVEITGGVDTEGAAGSIYATVPVVVTATTTAGAAQRFTGTYTLRRVNDVPGATPEQLRWHIAEAHLTAAP